MCGSSPPMRRIPCSTLAMISGSPSNSSIRKFSRSWSISGRNGTAWPKETHCPSSHVTVSCASASPRRNSRRRRDLPMPASPATKTTWPRPAFTSAKRSCKVAISRSRPTSRVTLDLPLPEVQRLEVPADRLVRRLGDHHAPRARGLLHARREVRRVADRGVVHPEVVADPAHDDGPRVDADPHLQTEAALGLELLRVIAERLLDSERRVDGAPRSVLVGDGRAEERHDAVARVLVDRALEPVDLRSDQLEAALDDAVHVLRIELLGERREPRHVGEEDRDLAALALERRARLEDLVGEVLGRVRRERWPVLGRGRRPRAG